MVRFGFGALAWGSTSGGVITFLCGILCAALFLSEYLHHRTTAVNTELRVDTVGVHKEIANAERLRVNIDVTFHALACELITLDTLDQAGETHHDVHDGHLRKRRLDRHGQPIDHFVKEPANKHKDITKAGSRLNFCFFSHMLASHTVSFDVGNEDSRCS